MARVSGERNSPTYIGRHPGCRHIRLAIVDDGESDPKRVAQWVAQGIRDGLAVERTTSAQVRAEGFGECETCAPGRTRRPRVDQATLGL